jgi:spermidine synthase
VAQVFAAFSGPRVKSEVAVVGLGTGTLAIYGRPGQRMTYYEIDPAVLRIASDTRWFTFLRDSPARIDVVLGDARLRLAEAPNGAYGLMVLDAFTSDAIPVHLVTREAIQLYLTKLQSDGVLVFNVSNRYLELEPVLEAVARGLGLSARIQRDDANLKPGEQASIWVVMARRDADLGALASDPRWRRLQGRPGVAAWTDDFSNLLGVLLWKTSAGVTKSPPPGESGEKRT